jgi:hypothetical protein
MDKSWSHASWRCKSSKTVRCPVVGYGTHRGGAWATPVDRYVLDPQLSVSVEAYRNRHVYVLKGFDLTKLLIIDHDNTSQMRSKTA